MNARISMGYAPIPRKDEHFSPIGERLSGGLTALFDRVLDHIERRRELTALAQMDDRSLKDIGLSRSDLGWPQV
jgi:uncharacterized protein YjiS (DUF1127 family)